MPLFDRGSSRPSPGRRQEPKVFRVSEVNRAVKFTLEDAWGDVTIEGELSDVHRSPAGHIYFALNDEGKPAQLRGVMFRGDARRCRAPFEDGARLKVRGSLSLYEPRGSFQLIARSATAAGAGDLAAQFAKIQKKLEAEGLMDPERKRSLPRLPTTIGVVTSKTSAALQDILRVSRERCSTRIVVADCRVQGEEGPRSIVAALEAIQRLPDLDVVIVARGGGSAEDLWSFNDEAVARAIAGCRVPVVSGVGHEVDVTIADLVADLRAATPSNAAELVVPVESVLVAEVEALERRLHRAFETLVGTERLRLERLSRKIADPRHLMGAARRRLETLETRLVRRVDRRLTHERARVSALRDELLRSDPRSALSRDRRRLVQLDARLAAALRPSLARREREHHSLMAKLDALSPLKVLERGYAIALDEESGRAIRKVDEAKPGAAIEVRVADGSFRARVEETS